MYNELMNELLPLMRKIKTKGFNLGFIMFQQVGKDTIFTIEIHDVKGCREETLFLMNVEVFFKNKAENLKKVKRIIKDYNNK